MNCGAHRLLLYYYYCYYHCSALVPLTNIVLLLGAPVLPTWRWVRISTYLHLEPFLLIAYMFITLDRIYYYYYYAIISYVITLICIIIIVISLFCACPSNKHCPSARCAYVANVVGKDLDIFALGTVSLNYIYASSCKKNLLLLLLLLCHHSYVKTLICVVIIFLSLLI
jgi:hypothetical protein